MFCSGQNGSFIRNVHLSSHPFMWSALYIIRTSWASEASLTLGCSIEISIDSASEAKLTNRRENFKISNQKVMKISIV